MQKKEAFFYIICLIVIDMLAYFISTFFAYKIRFFLAGISSISRITFEYADLIALWWIPALVIFIMFAFGVYHKRMPMWMESGKIIKSLLVSFVVSMTIVSLGHFFDYISRIYICVLWFFLAFTIITFRVIFRKIIFRLGLFQEKAILFVDKNSAYIENVFKKEQYLGIKVVDVINFENLNEKYYRKILAGEYNVAIISSEVMDDDLKSAYAFIQRNVNRLLFIPSNNAINIANSSSGQILSSQLGFVSINNSLKFTVNRNIKRLMDILLALVLIPVAVPLIGFLCILVKATSKGPAIFSHERVGRDGKKFKVYKLRSMYEDSAKRLEDLFREDKDARSEWEENFKLKNDLRITKIGLFLRKTSLDELPQIFNVILGNMSFVGPRPVIEEEIDKYYKEDKVYYYMTTPGITGLWQISGRSNTTYEERVALDNWYVFNWSLWLDIVILFSTPAAVIFRRGAY